MSFLEAPVPALGPRTSHAVRPEDRLLRQGFQLVAAGAQFQLNLPSETGRITVIPGDPSSMC